MVVARVEVLVEPVLAVFAFLIGGWITLLER
jgi:hypothetical protein